MKNTKSNAQIPAAWRVSASFEALGAADRRSAFYRISEAMFNESHKDFLGIVSTALAALPDDELAQVLPTRSIDYTLYGQKHNLKTLIDKYASSEDLEKNIVADALRALCAVPDTKLVDALFQREKLRTDLAHKSEFVDGCVMIMRALRRTISELREEVERLKNKTK